MAEKIFELNDVYFSYLGKFPALKGITLTVCRGEKLVLMGANGTGKSTLLLMLDGLIFPDAGTVTALGRRLSEEAFSDDAFTQSFRQKVGFVFQNADVQLFCPTVKEDIVFGPLQLGVPPQEAQRRLDELTERLSLGGLLDRSPHQLSVGEKRRVALASTLAIDPEVILLDEPTAGLDPATSRQVVDIILDANENGKTIVTATHDMHIIEEIADVVCVMSSDKTVAACRLPDELMRDTAFLEANNLVHVHRHRHKDTSHVHSHVHVDHHHQ